MKRLRDMNSPHVDIVRGKGLLIGVVLNEKAGGASSLQKHSKKRCSLQETHYNIIRFAPPLVIKKEEID